jgi:hypothetical protein
MWDDHDNFGLEADGEPVLVGLTRSEMLEFIRLDDLINANAHFRISYETNERQRKAMARTLGQA